jgi:hypothetical protein
MLRARVTLPLVRARPIDASELVVLWPALGGVLGWSCWRSRA